MKGLSEGARGCTAEAGLGLSMALLAPHSVETSTTHGVEVANSFGIVIVELAVFDSRCAYVSMPFIRHNIRRGNLPIQRWLA